MKIVGGGSALGGGSASGQEEPGTRRRLLTEILRGGPVTVARLAEILELTATGIRRHLDALQADGLVEVWENADSGLRGRGRPARSFVLTDAGHAAMTSGYDDLATAALEFVAAEMGEEAVRRFAVQRADDLRSRYAGAVESGGMDPRRRAAALADALSHDGYAASVRESPLGGDQLCQGHCPVHHVATRFPQLCEAETEAFSQLTGAHVQRLATLAQGAHVCTTYIPPDVSTPTYDPTSSEESTS